MNKDEIRAKLLAVSEEKYKEFNTKLQPSKSEIIGVRTAALRKLSKELAKDGWREYVNDIDEADSYEEKLIAGMSIFYAKTAIVERIEYMEKMIPFIDGWAVCDGICSTEGIKGSDRVVFWEYIKSCAESEDEFRTRFGLIAMRHSYIDEEHIDKIIGTIDSIKYDGYYDRMGAAWLLADCMVEFSTITMDYMKNNRLENWTFNKAISKMRESYRVSREDKEKLKAMIRKDS